jgi:hypothetical protein
LFPNFSTQSPTNSALYISDRLLVCASVSGIPWLDGKNYPWIVILYIPGGCTGLFQACDVGIQRILKLAIRQASHADVVNETLGALESGRAPEVIINDKSQRTPCNRSVNWIVQGYHAINKPEIVQKVSILVL